MKTEQASVSLEKGDTELLQSGSAVRLFDKKNKQWFFGRFKSLAYSSETWHLRMTPFFNVTPRGIHDPLDPGPSIFGQFPGIIVHERHYDFQAFILGAKGRKMALHDCPKNTFVFDFEDHAVSISLRRVDLEYLETLCMAGQQEDVPS